MLEHYPLYLAEEVTNGEVYIFESDIHGEYYISFIPAAHRFTDQEGLGSMVYEVNFTPVSAKDRKKGTDPRIQVTIFKAIGLFMDEKHCPILYVCDTKDLRQQCRSKLFIKWFALVDQTLYKHRWERITPFETTLTFGIISFASDPHFDTYCEQN